jgi:hypothetical protein
VCWLNATWWNFVRYYRVIEVDQIFSFAKPYDQNQSLSTVELSEDIDLVLEDVKSRQFFLLLISLWNKKKKNRKRQSDVCALFRKLDGILLRPAPNNFEWNEKKFAACRTKPKNKIDVQKVHVFYGLPQALKNSGRVMTPTHATIRPTTKRLVVLRPVRVRSALCRQNKPASRSFVVFRLSFFRLKNYRGVETLEKTV